MHVGDALLLVDTVDNVWPLLGAVSFLQWQH